MSTNTRAANNGLATRKRPSLPTEHQQQAAAVTASNMACTRPLKMYRANDGAVFFRRPKGNRKIDSNSGEEVDIPCGHCIACRIQYTREWTGRCMAENLDQPNGHFLTLTYRPEDQPLDLIPEDLTKFLDLLRYHNGKFRYYAVGEYGEKSGHSHFHLLYWPENQIRFGDEVSENLYTSPTICKAWPHGFITATKTMSSAAAAYVVGYVRKKLGTKQYISDDGEILHPPFARMSLGRGKNQGIGIPWILRHQREISINGKIIIDGKKYPISKDVIKKFDERNQNTLIYTQYQKLKGGQTQKNLDDIDQHLKSQQRNTKI